MDINKNLLISQQNTSHSITNNDANPYTYIQEMARCATTIPIKILDATTSISTRIIRYFRNELISVDELYLLCKQKDIACVKQQIEDALSPYSYSRCRAWLYAPLSTQGKTPIDFLTMLMMSHSGFLRKAYESSLYNPDLIADQLKKLKLDVLNRKHIDIIIHTIAHIIEQKYQSSVKNATPLGWIELQNPNNTPYVTACCTNCIIFQQINFIYRKSNNDNDRLDLLYRYEHSPHIRGSLTLKCATINGAVFEIIKNHSTDDSCHLELTKLQQWVRLLKNNPYDQDHTTGELQIRKSYKDLIYGLTKKIPYQPNLLNFAIDKAISLKQESERRNSKVKFNLNFEICKIIEELLYFLVTDKLGQTTGLNIANFLTEKNFCFIKEMANSGEFPSCKQALKLAENIKSSV